MDYRELLKKYIAHVDECEGTNFIPYSPSDNVRHSDIGFTQEEVDILQELDKENTKERG